MNISPEQAQGLAMVLIQGIEREIPTTTKILAAVPQDKLGFRLGDKGRTAQDLMWHIVGSDLMFAEGVAAGEFVRPQMPAAPDSSQEIASRYESGLTAALAKVKALNGAQLAKPINFMNVFEMPAVIFLQVLHKHCIHHPGPISTHLRAMKTHRPSIYRGRAEQPLPLPGETLAH